MEAFEELQTTPFGPVKINSTSYGACFQENLRRGIFHTLLKRAGLGFIETHYISQAILHRCRVTGETVDLAQVHNNTALQHFGRLEC